MLDQDQVLIDRVWIQDDHNHAHKFVAKYGIAVYSLVSTAVLTSTGLHGP